MRPMSEKKVISARSATVWLTFVISVLSFGTRSHGDGPLPESSIKGKVSDLLIKNVRVNSASGASGLPRAEEGAEGAIRQSVDRLIPSSFMCSEAELQLIAGGRWTIDSAEPEYVAARCDLEALNIRAKLPYLRRFPPLDEKRANEVRLSLEAALKPIQAFAASQPVAIRDTLVTGLGDIGKSLSGQVGRDPFVYFLRNPVPAADIEDASANFPTWLQASLANAESSEEVKRACLSTLGKLKRSIQTSTTDKKWLALTQLF